MAEPFLSEIRIVGFNFAPRGWAFCDGQILPISQNQSLYSLLGTTFGGDGRTTFALPDLRGRVPIHFDGTYALGSKGGQESVTLSTSEMPAHTHVLNAVSSESVSENSQNVAGNSLGTATPNNVYSNAAHNGTLAASSVLSVGGSQAHENRQPYLVLNICIALQGVFPSRN